MFSLKLASLGVACGLLVSGTVAGGGAGLSDENTVLGTSHGLARVAGRETSVGTLHVNGRLTRLYGGTFSQGDSPEASVQTFLDANADLVGSPLEDLVPLPRAADGSNALGLMWDRATESYKFTALYYQQQRGGVPVYGGRVTFVVRNEPGFPLVLANTDVRNLAKFKVDAGVVGAPMTMISQQAVIDRVKDVSPIVGQPVITSTRQVIWAGVNDDFLAPRLAHVSEVRNDVDEWRVISDAATGDVLFEEHRICTADLVGNVSGLATEGIGAEQCENEVETALPYLRVTAGGVEAYTDSDGNYVLGGLLGGPVTLEGRLEGLWFDVFTAAGAPAVESEDVSAPTHVDLLFNATNVDPLIRAQVNAYYESNRVRDFVIAYNPDYPTLSQSGFPVNTNETGGLCPGNAWYSPSEVTINFCQAGSGYPNTAWSSVVHHEYGHHLVEVAGSGQGEYGEGMGDAMSALVLDDPALGFGFFGDCDGPLRNADNDCQYQTSGCSSCGSAIHACGQLLAGCVWDTRNALTFSHPGNYTDIIGALAVNAMLVHSGSSIDPSITIDYLTLDDDDDTIYNGTPHYSEIASGFGLHNMDAPVLPQITFNFPNGLPELVLPSGGTQLRVEVTGVVGSPVPGTGTLYFDDGDGVVQIAMEQVSPNVYDAVFPGAPCGAQVSYYFSADAQNGDTDYWPVAAPGDRFGSVAATGLSVVVEDDFEVNNGWTVANEDLDDGAWSRGVPVGGGDRGDPAADFDGSGACWLTDNADGNSDVDGGPTRLTGPVFDLSGAGQPYISYARWFTNDDNDIDRLQVHISNDGGDNWTLVESIGHNDNWVKHQFRVDDVITPTATMRLRFSATDNPNDSVTEAGIDDLRVVDYDCDEPDCLGDIDGDGSLGFTDLLDILSNWGPCVGCPQDVDGDEIVGFADLLHILSNWGPCP